ncbi:MAG TPA: hypothetical protein PLD54_01155 [Candidatus Levybacteria bacterium]|mgnify:CR=1 FL=1|nr:hypothetical protein [Candidatus Levybacteria bacterium]
MNEQLTVKGKSGHTNTMDERGENSVFNEVGEVFDRADSLVHGLEAIGNKLKQSSKESEEEKRRSEEEKKKTEEKIRKELENTAKNRKSVPDTQEQKLTELTAKLSKEDQALYKQIFQGIPDPAKRENLLRSIQARVQEKNVADTSTETTELKADDVSSEDGLQVYLEKKVTAQIDSLKRKALEHIRNEGGDLKTLETLSLDIDNAFSNGTYKLREKAKKGEWDSVVAHLKQLEHDTAIRLAHFDRSDQSEQEVTDDISNQEGTKDVIDQGELARELLEAEVKQHVAVAADRFRKGEGKISQTDDLETQDQSNVDPQASEIPNMPESEHQETKSMDTSSVEAPIEESEDFIRVTEPKGKLHIDPDIVYSNAGLTREEDPIRIKRAEEILKTKFSEEQEKAVLNAHYYGVSEDGKDAFDKSKSVYNYSVADLRHKYKILEDAGFNKDQIRKLMEYGITGTATEASSATSQLDAMLGTSSYVSNGEFPYSDHTSSERIGRKSYERYGGMDEYYDSNNLERQAQEIYAAQKGRTIVDDVGIYEDEYAYVDNSSAPSSFLYGELDDPQTFSIKGFNKRLFGEMHRLYKNSRQVPSHVKDETDSVLKRLGSGLQRLKAFQEQRDQVEQELTALRDQYWLSNGSREIKAKLSEGEKRLIALENQFKAMARPLLNELGGATQNVAPYASRIADEGHALDTEQIGGGGVGDAGDGGWDDGRGGNGRRGDGGGNGGSEERGGNVENGRGGDRNGEGEPPQRLDRLRGRGEGEDSEEDPFGRSVRSIEDVGHFMELVTAEFKYKIMAAVYRGSDNSVITEEELLKGVPDDSTKEMLKENNRLYAYKVSQGEYARDYENLTTKPNEQGKNKVLMLTKDEIIDKDLIDERTIRLILEVRQNEHTPAITERNRDKIKAWIGTRPRGQNPNDYWEGVSLVRPEEFMNWIRNYWTIVHGDDPDNPNMNFFSEIVVNHPDQRGQVNAGQMHKNAGAFLRSRFLTDPATGELRVYESLKDQIINEVWVPSGERNKEIFYKKVMHSDEELPKQFANQIAGDNLMAKTAAGGKNTMEMFFTLPEKFRVDFHPITGEPIAENKREDDIGFGSGMLLAYEIYYNISDFEGLKKLLGPDASLFNRDFITRAVLERMGSEIPENLNDPVRDEKGNTILVPDENGKMIVKNYYKLAQEYLIVRDEKENGTVVDENLYDENSQVKTTDKEALRRWIVHMNPYSPPQKDDTMLAVIRKVIENQMQEIVGIEKSASASGLAEFHAYYRTYHDGIASRHDISMGNRNSQSKYEFLGAPGGYQDKQEGRDRAGNLYTKGLVWGPTVGVLHAMPTRDGETVQDVLRNAVTLQMNAGKEYRRMLGKAKSGQTGIDVEQIRRQVSGVNPTNIEGDKDTNDILEKIRKIDAEISQAKDLPTLIKKKQQQRYHLVQQAIETRLRNSQVSNELAKAWER